MKNALVKVRSYARDLVQDESGMELLQVAVIVALAAALIGVIGWLFTVIGNKINEAAEDVNNADISPGGSQSPWGTGGGTDETP